MIRMIDREFVRECSFAFPPDSPLPQLSSALPRQLRRKMPSFEVDADDLVTLRFYLRRRVACIQTSKGIVAWKIAAASQLQVNYRQASPQPRLDVRPADQAARLTTWDAASPASARIVEAQGSHVNGDREENGLGQGISAPTVLEGEANSIPVARNGNHVHQPVPNGESATNGEFGHSTTDGNGSGEQTGRGSVRLELLETGSEEPHIILSSDTYSLALLGRYRLLAETLAGWAGTTMELVSS